MVVIFGPGPVFSTAAALLPRQNAAWDAAARSILYSMSLGILYASVFSVHIP